MTSNSKLVKNFIDNLQPLSKVLYEPHPEALKTKKKADLALYAAFDLCRSGTSISQEESATIVPLLSTALRPIEFCISNTALLLEPSHIEEALTIRSGLQYILDTFRHQPALQQQLEQLKKGSCIPDIDEAIDRCADLYSRKDEDDDGYAWYPIKKPSNVPTTHNWWQKF